MHEESTHRARKEIAESFFKQQRESNQKPPRREDVLNSMKRCAAASTCMHTSGSKQGGQTAVPSRRDSHGGVDDGRRGRHHRSGSSHHWGHSMALIPDERVVGRALQASPVNRRVARGAQHRGPNHASCRSEPGSAETVPKRVTARKTESPEAHADTRGGGRESGLEGGPCPRGCGGGGNGVGETVSVSPRHHVHRGGVEGHLEVTSLRGLLGSHQVDVVGLVIGLGGDVLKGGVFLIDCALESPSVAVPASVTSKSTEATSEAAKTTEETAVPTTVTAAISSHNVAAVPVASNSSATDTSTTVRTSISRSTVSGASVAVSLQVSLLLGNSHVFRRDGLFLNGGVGSLLCRSSATETASPISRASRSRTTKSVSTGTPPGPSTETSAAICRGTVHRADKGGAPVGCLVDSGVTSLSASIGVPSKTRPAECRTTGSTQAIASVCISSQTGRATHPPGSSSPELTLGSCLRGVGLLGNLAGEGGDSEEKNARSGKLHRVLISVGSI
mmetsp:Transcript_26518/g.52073  ORF Transcript_26518/g.52073 Transcript_26518/m.52073 type:complete len:504 (+) Transcript_26518:724-2235(+)